jgi:acetyl-CoA carboxylase/biotin carboxylase 1
MYTDEDARGGVLEPEGIINIKYRRDKELETMACLDATYGELRKQAAGTTLPAKLAEIKAAMTARENLLVPVYVQVSLQFANLHDRAGRMKAKSATRDSLKWRESRRFFYWRVRRRLNEEYILKRMQACSKDPLASRARHLETLCAWTGITGFGTADPAVAVWYEETRKAVHDKVEAMRSEGEGVAWEIAALLRVDRGVGLGGVKQMLGMVPVEEREETLRFLSEA